MSFPDKNIRYPFGEAEVLTPDSAATIAITVSNPKTIVKIDLGHAATVNVTPDPELEVGAELVFVLKSDGTARNVTYGTNITGPVTTGTIDKTKLATFIYDGTAFLASAAIIQID
jgi:hypothetical protein